MYIFLWKPGMTAKTARLFVNGGSQAVRLPAEFRFENTSEVGIRRDAFTGDVILSANPTPGLSQFFAVRDQAPVTGDPAAGRPHNAPFKPRRTFDGD